MSENISVTRIVDLPEGPYMGAGAFTAQGTQKDAGGFSNTYLPIDVHPNPYGMPPPPPGGILPPEHTQSRVVSDKQMQNQQLNQQYQQSQQQQQQQQYIPEVQQRLPQRDIPMNMSDHTQDEQIQPNYIPPPPKNTKDYIKDYQQTQDRQIREYEEKKMREKVREHWLESLQWPILVGLVYFVFQLPIVNTVIFKRFSFLSIYREDGNFNMIGLTLKSVLFAGVYVFIQKSLEFME